MDFRNTCLIVTTAVWYQYLIANATGSTGASPGEIEYTTALKVCEAR